MESQEVPPPSFLDFWANEAAQPVLWTDTIARETDAPRRSEPLYALRPCHFANRGGAYLHSARNAKAVRVPRAPRKRAPARILVVLDRWNFRVRRGSPDVARPFYAACCLSAPRLDVLAYWMVHAPKNVVPPLNAGDAAILYCFVFLLFVFTGPGAWS